MAFLVQLGAGEKTRTMITSRPTTLRPATRADVPTLVAMNIAAYPELVADGVVFDAAQLLAQTNVFPEGQIVAECDGAITGAIATLIVRHAAAMAPHTWTGMTSYGTFACHDARGDALYLADIYADPRSRGRGVGAALYAGLFALCARRNLRCVVAGGRLWGYHAVAANLSPQDYVDEVVRGVRHDRVLTAQLRAGFVVRSVLDGYLADWRSAGFATHLVWENPRLAVTRDGRPTQPGIET
jgi:GNAT superfamily N-acetyltransferase